MVLNVLGIGQSHAYWLGKFVDAWGFICEFRETWIQMQDNFLELRDATVSLFRRDVMARIRRQSPHLVNVKIRREWKRETNTSSYSNTAMV